jgi:hypothetical protein
LVPGSVEQLQELAQRLYEVLLSEQEAAKVSIRWAQASGASLAQQRQQLVESRIDAEELQELRMTFAILDMNGDGDLTVDELIRAQNMYGGPDPNRDRAMRAAFRQMDSEQRGFLDFYQFCMMTNGLEGYVFADTGASSAKKSPQLHVITPQVVAGNKICDSLRLFVLICRTHKTGTYKLAVGDGAGELASAGLNGQLYLIDAQTEADVAELSGSIALVSPRLIQSEESIKSVVKR